MEEGSDWFWAIARAYLFVRDQLKNGNYYASALIEASLVEYSVKFLLILKEHSKSDVFSDSELANLERISKHIFDENFARNIERAYTVGLISRRLKLSLDRFRRMRNDVIHEAFFSGITNKEARRFVSIGHKVMNVLGDKIAKLIP